MKQHFFKTTSPRGFAGLASAAAGLTLMITAPTALAQDGRHMLGEHSQGMMGTPAGHGMMGDTTGQGMMNNGDHSQEMMGADDHMMGNDSHHMTGNSHGMHGPDRQ